MTDLNLLAERCEKATGPDRELDKAIFALLPSEFNCFKYPAFTASIDAAMTLVPEGQRRVEFGTYNGGDGWAYVHIGSERVKDQFGESDGCATEALALCAAALRSRAIMEKGDE